MAKADAEAFASAAEALIGTPFRLHGRNPASGLDCIGLVYASLVAAGAKPLAPRGYQLRNTSIAQWLNHAELSGFAKAGGPITRGDVILIQPSPFQHHLLIAANDSCAVHAHAGLRKVALEPLPDDMVICAHWRLARTTQG